MAQTERPTDPATGAPAEFAVARRLEQFVPAIGEGRRAELAELVVALRSPGLGGAEQWAHIDLVTAFDPESAIHGRDGGGDVWRLIATIGVFLPLVLTWIGLHQAITAYERMPDAGRSANFFQQWISGFPEKYAGFLGGLNNLSHIAVVTAIMFGLLILAGWMSDRRSHAAQDQQLAFRGALTDAMRVLDVRFPESPGAAVAAVRDLAEQLRATQASASATQASLIESHREALEATTGVVNGMAAAMTAKFHDAVAELESATAAFHGDLERRYRTAAAAQELFVESMHTALAQCTQAMAQAGELVAAMANHTYEDFGRTADTDRIITHMADSAFELGRAATRLEAALQRIGT